jgi:DNA repair exonuclease SbcCD ATPase subunit
MSLTRRSQDQFKSPLTSKSAEADIYPRAHLHNDKRSQELEDRLNASEFERRRLERMVEDLRRRLSVYEEYEEMHDRSREEFQQLYDQFRLLKTDNQELQAREQLLQSRVEELQKENRNREQAELSLELLKEKLIKQVEDYKAQYEEQRRLTEHREPSSQLMQELAQAKSEIGALQADYRSNFSRLQEELERSKRNSQDVSFRQLADSERETYEGKIQELESKLKEQGDYNSTLKDQIKYLYEKGEEAPVRTSPPKSRVSASTLGSTRKLSRGALQRCRSCKGELRKSQG